MSLRIGGMQPLHLLIILLVGVGGWNFYTNTQLENAVPRPFQNYSDAGLEQLISQYQGDMDVHNKRYQAATSGPSVRVQERGHLGDQVNEFERVQRISQQRRGMENQVTDRQISLDQLRSEQGKRAADRPIYRLVFRRLFSREI
jgi:hypothetical protein